MADQTLEREDLEKLPKATYLVVKNTQYRIEDALGVLTNKQQEEKITELQSAIDSNSESISSISTSVTSLEATVAGQSATINANSATIAKNTESIASVLENNASISESVASLNRTVATNTSAIQEKADKFETDDNLSLDNNKLSVNVGSMTLTKVKTASKGNPNTWKSMGQSYILNGSRLTYANESGIYAIKGGRGGFYTSTNGLDWSCVFSRQDLRAYNLDEAHNYSNFGMQIDQNYGGSIIGAFGKFFISGSNGVIYYSDVNDCTIGSWTALNAESPIETEWTYQRFNKKIGNTVYFVSNNKTIKIQEDLSFEVVDNNTEFEWVAGFEDLNGVTVALNSSGQIVYSSDLQEWTVAEGLGDDIAMFAVANNKVYFTTRFEKVYYYTENFTEKLTTKGELKNTAYIYKVVYYKGYYFYIGNDANGSHVYRTTSDDLSNPEEITIEDVRLRSSTASHCNVFIIANNTLFIHDINDERLYQLEDDLITACEVNYRLYSGKATYMSTPNADYLATEGTTFISTDAYEYKITDIDLTNGNIVKVNIQ